MMDSRRVTLLDAGSQHCRWIDGEIKGKAAVCGLPVHKHTSWCEKHHRQVFSQNTKRAQARFYLLARSAGHPTKG